MKTPKLKLFSAEPRSSCSVAPKRNTTKAEDRAREEQMLDELLRQVIVEADHFATPKAEKGNKKAGDYRPGFSCFLEPPSGVEPETS